MKRIRIIIYLTVFFLSILYSFTVKAQARMVMNNNVYMVMENAAVLVIQNPQPNALVTSGTGGNIVSEDEFDRLQWHMGGITGLFTIPFTNEAGVKIPFSMDVTNPDNIGYFQFSTYMGSTWDNSTYMPSDVTHMNNSSGVNNSANVIDRFWMMEPQNSTVVPFNATLSFGYDDAEHLAAGNSIVEANLGAQRFNSTLLIWGDYLPTGTANPVINSVSNAPFTKTNFQRTWTLSETTSALPVELAIYEFDCVAGNLVLHWITLTETNNMFFTIESSDNGIVFATEATIAGAGNSNQQLEYSYQTNGSKYYRLTQTDYNGMTEELGTLFANCTENTELVYWQSMDKLNEIKVSGLMEGEIQFLVYDMGGKLLVNEKSTSSSSAGVLYLPDLANGMYTISISNGERVVTGMVMMVK